MGRVELEILRAVIAAAGFVLIVLGWRWSRRSPDHKRDRALTLTWWALALIAIGAYFGFSPERLTTRQATYDLVHYYLNAKYYPELEYTRLYDAVLVADSEESNRLWRAKRLRNLNDNVIRGPRAVAEVR